MALSRRSLLGYVGAASLALAGCSTRRAPSASSTRKSDTPRTDQGSTPPERSVTTQSATDLSGDPFSTFRVDATPPGVPLAHDATFVSEATKSTPARIRVTVGNPTDGSHAVRTGNYGLPFPNPVSETTADGTNLVLDEEYDDPDDGCWEGYGEIEPMAETAELAPDETLQAEHFVLNYAENETCWPPGEYRFDVGYTLDPDGDAVEYDWGFELVI